MACHLNLEAHRTGLLVVKRGLVAHREVGEGHTLCESGSALCVQVEWRGVTGRGDRVALIFLVTIVGSIESVAIGRGALVEEAGVIVVEHQTAPIYHGEVLEALLQGRHEGLCVLREAVVVAPLHSTVVGVGTNHSYLHVALQREQVVLVLQQHHTLMGHLQGECAMLLTSDHIERNLVPLVRDILIHLSQTEAGREQTQHVLVDVALLDESATHGIGQGSKCLTTFEVGSAENGGGGCRSTVGMCLVATLYEEVVDGPTVAHDDALIAPVVAQNLGK